MKLRGVRIGERFVFDHVGGVWTKTSDGKARCIYGSNFKKEMPLDPNVSVYVIFEDKNAKPNDREQEEVVGAVPVVKQDAETQTDKPCSEVVVSEAIPCALNTSPPVQVITEGVSIEKSELKPVSQPAGDFVSIPEGKSILTPGQKPIVVVELPKDVRMILADEDENVLMEIKNASAAQIVAYSQAEEVRLSDKQMARRVLETYVDHVTQTIYVVLGRA